MSKRTLQELVKDTVDVCRNPPHDFDFDPSAVAVCPPHLIHLMEQKVIAELKTEISSGECVFISAESMMLKFWEDAKSKGDNIEDHKPRTMRRLMDYEQQEFLKHLFITILNAFETRQGLKTCLITGLWIFYPSIHTSTILSDLKNRNLKGQVIFLYPGIDQDGIYLKLLGLDDGFGYKARRI
jgi:BREX protein BrxB